MDGGSPDRGGDADSGVDEGVLQDSTVPDADVGVDAQEDSWGADGGADVTDEAPSDVQGPDSNCGELNATTNCGSCGATCAAAGPAQTSAQCCSGGVCPGSPSGSGNSCQYSCSNGYLDCNASVAPNIDGCECHVPGATQSQCCTASGGDCPIRHNNGLTMFPFYDCVPAGTMDSQLAQEACIAYVGTANANQCQMATGTPDASAPDSWCSGSFTGDCVCWTFAGPRQGEVFDAMAQGGTPPTTCDFGAGTSTFN